jgi:hypothetical protein
MIIKVTLWDGIKNSETISEAQAKLEQTSLINAGMVIARSNVIQTELRCKRTGNRTIYTSTLLFDRAEQLISAAH